MSVSKWQYAKAKDYFKYAVDEVGTPTFVANVRGGMAVWKGRTPFVEHILRDESVRHCVPAAHHDFFYSTMKIYVPPNKLKDVLTISGSISYDGLKKHLTARCGGIGANIATLYLGAKVASGEYSIAKVKKGGLYVKHIREEAETYSFMKREMNRIKRTNHKKYARQLRAPYYGLAFKGC